MRIYYAHCMAIYSTPQEDRDITLLETIFPGECIINPNAPMINKQCAAIHAEVDAQGGDTRAGEIIMNTVFKPLVLSADVVVFRALPDGMIPAGVLKEVQWAVEAGIPVLELPSAMSRRELSLTATKQYLKEIGQR